jgi:hypothetical protein
MPKIALFDDRHKVRNSLKRNFELAKPANWEVIASPPLSDPAKYVDWILKEDVQVLVIDWVLDEQGNDVDSPVNYKGGSVVSGIRMRLPEMPVFVITAHPGDEDLKEHLGDVEAVFTRAAFSGEPEKFIKPMVRAGQRFAKRFQDDLNKLTALSIKVAAGKATTKESDELRALQAVMGLMSGIDREVSRSASLDKFEKQLGVLEQVNSDIRKFLKRKKRS